MSEKQKYIDFEVYERVAEPHKRERASVGVPLLVFRTWVDTMYLLYNIYHPCATESLRFSFSRFFCAMAILLCSRAFSSSPTLASSNGFLVTTMV